MSAVLAALFVLAAALRPAATQRLSEFFAGQRRNGENAFDPRVLFDEASGRFFVVAVGDLRRAQTCAPGSCVSHFFLAVSKSGAPGALGAGEWYFYALDATLDTRTPTTEWADFPSLGVSADAVAITAQMFPFGETATVTNKTLKIRVLAKEPLLHGGPVAWMDFSTFDPAIQANTSFQPVHHFGASDALFVMGYIRGACGFSIIGIRNAATAPELSTQVVVSGLSCEGPPGAPQPEGRPDLFVASGLRTPPIYRDGSLWVVRNVAYRTGTGTVAGIQWSQIDVSQWPAVPTFVQQAVLADPQAALMYPAMAVDAGGNMAIIFGRSSATAYASLMMTGRLASDPPGTLRPPIGLRTGEASLNVAVDPGRRNTIAYGDYFGAAVDPVDGTVWMLGEFIRTATTSGRWASQVAFPAAASEEPRLVGLDLNRRSFHPGDVMQLMLTLAPSPSLEQADLYVLLRLPDGHVMSLRRDGTLTGAIEPLARRVLAEARRGELARFRVPDGLPQGAYGWTAYLARPGTGIRFGRADQRSFTISP